MDIMKSQVNITWTKMSCHHTTLFFLDSLTPADSCALVFWANSCCVTCARNAQRCSSARDRTCIHSAGACCQHSWKAHKYWEGNIQRFIHSYQFIVNARKWNLNVNWSKRASILFWIIFVKRIKIILWEWKWMWGAQLLPMFLFCNLQFSTYPNKFPGYYITWFAKAIYRKCIFSL
jgi:hypothetical protein